jgi:hypothetical protein
MTHRILRVLVAAAALAVPRAAGALDTLETYEPGGLTRFEAAAGMAGLGRPAREHRVSMAYLLGMGVTDRFSLHYAGSARSTERLDAGRSTQGFGLLATVLDSYNLDLDLTLDVMARSGGRLLVGPGFELNVDAAPDRSSFGLFVQGGPAVGGRVPNPDLVLYPAGRWTVPAAIGSYCAIADGHRALVAIDATFLPGARGAQHALEAGSLRLGYAGALVRQLVVLPEVFLRLPQGAERVSAGFWLGVRADVF